VALAYLGLFVSAFLAATLLPLASEVPLALLVRSSGRLLAPVIVATAGNYLGACTTYLLARILVRRAGSPDPGSHAVALIRRFGAPALILSWVPIVGDGLVALAGAVGIGFGAFSLWVLVGKAGRYAVVAWLAQEIT
jgi:membrane protein YqaA with SNARE-associated domain